MVIGLSEAELRTKLRSLEKAYRELQDSEQKYRLLFEDSAEGMISWDNERTIIAVNKIGAEILGYELPDSLIGLIVTDFFIDEAEAQPLLMIELGYLRDIQVSIRKKDGSRGIISINQTVHRDDSGKISRYEAVFRDITEAKEIHEERERTRTVESELEQERLKRESVEELDELKNKFISTAAHELRTPVTAILGYADFMLTSDLLDTDLVMQDLAVIYRNALRLKDMTDDLLDVQRLTSGRLTLQISEFDIVKNLQEIAEELSALFSDKGQQLVLNIPESQWIEADSSKIDQVLINLLRNANKFTPEEGIVTVNMSSSAETLTFSIVDNGIGVACDDLLKLFKPFPGIDHGLHVSSTGLGLSLCKGIIDLHNGDIQAASEGLGRGTVFTVVLPIRL